MIKIVDEYKNDSQEMRSVYTQTLIQQAGLNSNIVALEADLMSSDGMSEFKKNFPERLVDVGIAEQSLVTAAAGLSWTGLIPFAHTFATFITRRPCDQIYISCAYSKANVKLVGSDPGIAGELNGGTHQAMEDIAILRSIPNITIFEPSDAVQLNWAIRQAAEIKGLCYIRLYRKQALRIYAEGSEFKIGKGVIVEEGTDVTIIALGAIMLEQALKAAAELRQQGISVRVVDPVCVKPIDKKLILQCAKETKAMVVAENHSTTGGLASSVAEVLVQNRIAIPFASIGIKNSFGEVGQQDYLLRRFEMSDDYILKTVVGLLNRK
jgi:transketolase